jgi:hypothetical protein
VKKGGGVGGERGSGSGNHGGGGGANGNSYGGDGATALPSNPTPTTTSLNNPTPPCDSCEHPHELVLRERPRRPTPKPTASTTTATATATAAKPTEAIAASVATTSSSATATAAATAASEAIDGHGAGGFPLLLHRRPASVECGALLVEGKEQVHLEEEPTKGARCAASTESITEVKNVSEEALQDEQNQTCSFLPSTNLHGLSFLPWNSERFR